MPKSYNEGGLFSQVKSDKDYSGKNSVLKGILIIIGVIALVSAGIYFL